MLIKPGKYYKLIIPQWNKTVGQGTPPTVMTITVRNSVYNLKYGDVYKASLSADNTNKVGNLLASTPTLNIEFIQKHIEQFEEITINKEELQDGI